MQEELETAIKKLEDYVGSDGKGNEDLKEIAIELQQYEQEINNLRSQNQELANRLEMGGDEIENLQKELEATRKENQNKEITIENLKKNLDFFAKGNKDKSGTGRRELEKEIARLMAENENLRMRLVQLQREFEEKETELISEINKLIIEINDNRSIPKGEEGSMSIHKMVENIKLQNELR